MVYMTGVFRIAVASLALVALATAAGAKTIDISLENGSFVPSRVSADEGDVLHLCNRGKLVRKPFSIDRKNTFETRLDPGQCYDLTVHYTKVPHGLFIHDELPGPKMGDHTEGCYNCPVLPGEGVVWHSSDQKLVVKVKPAGDLDLSGTYVSDSNPDSIYTISESAGALAGSETWKAGDRSGTNTWSDCHLSKGEYECKWTGSYLGDPTKTGTRWGHLEVSVDGKTLGGTYYEDRDHFVTPEGKDEVSPSMHPGATWPIRATKKEH